MEKFLDPILNELVESNQIKLNERILRAEMATKETMKGESVLKHFGIPPTILDFPDCVFSWDGKKIWFSQSGYHQHFLSSKMQMRLDYFKYINEFLKHCFEQITRK